MSNGIDWAARHDAVAQADGEEWERLLSAFEADWADAYSKAFVEIAVARGWRADDAATWPEETVDDALRETAPKFAFCPVASAAHDVIETELDCANL